MDIGVQRVAGVPMTRRVALRVAGVLMLPLSAGAQQVAKVYRVGFLSMGVPDPTGGPAAGADLRPLEAFKQGLLDAGWVEGRNLVIEYRLAEGRPDRLATMAEDLASRKVDLIAATPTPAAAAALKATRTIPIVGMGLVEPVALGLVVSLANPGGNLTGLTYSVGSDIYGKQLQLLKQMVPQARRVALLVNIGSSPAMPLIVDSVKTAAASLGLQLQVVPARGPDDFDAAFASMAAEKAGSLLVMGDSVFFYHRLRLNELAMKHRLPSMSTQGQWAEAGGLIAYGPNMSDLFRRGAGYIDKILRGAQPRHLPIEQPTKFELFINLKTAAALGLTVPQPMLLSADQVIR
ncbi:MAG TPA: ABC transporter substrate-binding protein [Burkholderiaceae bacterium]|nr:ABC transporter substrate-binding protein [Burkholderiaceae bacterium]